MIRLSPRHVRTTPFAVVLALGACQPAPEDGTSEVVEPETPTGTSAAEDALPSPAGDLTIENETTVRDGAVDCAGLRTEVTQEAARSETGARSVLLDWGAALENGRFDRAWCQFAKGGMASGMSRTDYARYWSRFDRLTVAIGEGTMEGAAGTSYYRAPVTVTAVRSDAGTTELAGEVVLSRTNDVPGATSTDLQWTIRSARLGGT